MQHIKALQADGLQLMPAWRFAGIPLLAGVAQIVINGMKPFQ
jgi:hypothetical protein